MAGQRIYVKHFFKNTTSFFTSPFFFSGDYSPFCGPNGKTYSNLCNAMCELGTGGIAGGYLGECGAKTTTKKGGTANDACAVNRVESSVSACSYGNGDSAEYVGNQEMLWWQRSALLPLLRKTSRFSLRLFKKIGG